MDELVNVERAFLSYASMGKICDKWNLYPSFLVNCNCIAIRNYLVSKGYLVQGNYVESIPYYPYKDLRALLSLKGIKPGNGKQLVISNATKNLSESDLIEYFGYCCFFPTDKGTKAKLEQGTDAYYIDLELDKLKVEDYERYQEYIIPDYANAVYISDETANKTKSYMTTENGDNIKLSRYNNCFNDSTISLYHNEKFIDSFSNVDSVLYFSTDGYLVITKKINDKEHHVQVCDLSKDIVLGIYTFMRNPWDYINEKGFGFLSSAESVVIDKEETANYEKHWNAVNDLLNNQKGIFEKDGSVNYYFSIEDIITKVIIEEYFKDCKLVTVGGFFEDDLSTNYKLTIPKDRPDLEYFIIWMYSVRKISEPKMYGIPIYRYFSYHYRAGNEYFQKKVDYLYDCISSDKIELLKFFGKKYPYKLIYAIEGYKNYKSSDYNIAKEPYVYVCENYQYFEKLYADTVLLLKEHGKISSKWVNEFNLYMMVKAYFEDTIYQYRADWLEMQSLDIYIPRLKVAIEYQGQQHYEAIEFFGGTEALQYNIRRDELKREKCLRAGIKLIEWNYQTEVSEINFLSMCEANDIVLPNDKKK